MPFFYYVYGDLSMTEALHRHPGTRMGLSDAGAHCGAICDGGTPTFMLTHWARDRTRGPRLPLELVVHRQTRQTSFLYGLTDRGLITPGMKADINIIDFDRLSFEKPRMAFDLPAGARRLVQRAVGYGVTGRPRGMRSLTVQYCSSSAACFIQSMLALVGTPVVGSKLSSTSPVASCSARTAVASSVSTVGRSLSAGTRWEAPTGFQLTTRPAFTVMTPFIGIQKQLGW